MQCGAGEGVCVSGKRYKDEVKGGDGDEYGDAFVDKTHH